ncbi:trypsin-like peptidase domain-containing protein [Micromonospora sp. NPDC050980]|uniref:S1C family serine protease n=1 Tax=Micromonospora sp. NPDC050980 TaxID=3155161 RepID=UPI0033E5A8A9
MAGGYRSGDGVPRQDGDGPADRPGPLPPRIAPPGASHPVPAPHPTFGAHHPTAPPRQAAVGPTYPARSDAAGPSSDAAGPSYDAAGPSYDAAARAASPVVPAQPGSGPAHPGAPSAGPNHPGQFAPGSSHPGEPATSSTYPGRSASGSFPAAAPAAGPSYAPAPGFSYPAPPALGPAHPAQSGSYPTAPAAASPYPGQPVSGPAFPAPAYPGQPHRDPGQPGFAAPPLGARTDRPGRGGRLSTVALALAGVLAVVTGVQAYQIHRLDDRLAAADRRTAEGQGADARRLDGLEQRAGSLEKQAGAAFNPEAVASAVLPSVFRVRAGQFTGTAFAVGKPPSGGGTTLLTNFHVVESVVTAGERTVFLERTDQRFEATIVATDKDKDLAQLRTTAKFGGLVAARTPVKSGQQIVVVGAPLGLQDSVTTGVVSAFRKDEGGSGPVIQFDAPINPGNSGGPVINGSKEVVGIATAKARDAEGIGLAVPIKTACDRFKLC